MKTVVLIILSALISGGVVYASLQKDKPAQKEMALNNNKTSSKSSINTTKAPEVKLDKP